MLREVKELTPTLKASFISMGSVAFMAFFSFPFQIASLTSNFILMLAIINRLDKKIVMSLNATPSFFKSMSVVLSATLILRILFSYNSIVKLRIVNSIASSKESKLSIVNDLFQELWPELSNNNDYLELFGQALYNRGNYPKAISVLNLAAKSSSKYDTYLLLGACYEKLNQIKQAESCYSKCNYLIPSLYTGRYQLMMLYYKNGQHKKSKELAYVIRNSKVKIESETINNIKSAALKIINDEKRF